MAGARVQSKGRRHGVRHNPPLERTVPAGKVLVGREPRVCRPGRSTALRYARTISESSSPTTWIGWDLLGVRGGGRIDPLYGDDWIDSYTPLTVPGEDFRMSKLQPWASPPRVGATAG